MYVVPVRRLVSECFVNRRISSFETPGPSSLTGPSEVIFHSLGLDLGSRSPTSVS